jgi:hypothetical protein
MKTPKKIIIPISVGCGAVLLVNATHPSMECKPLGFCVLPANHMPDLPERHPGSTRTSSLHQAVSTAPASTTIATWVTPGWPPPS